MRYVIGKKNHHLIKKKVNKYLKYEKKNNIDNIEGCINFKKECEISKKKLIKKVNGIKKKGKNIVGYAATSKSTTILNYCKIGNDIIDYICDTTPEKIGKFTPGTHIPVVSMNRFKEKVPDSIFLFAWNHKKEIFKKEKKFIKKGKWFAHVKI